MVARIFLKNGHLGVELSCESLHVYICIAIQCVLHVCIPPLCACVYMYNRVLVVKQQWFWESIQIEACADEALYQAKVRCCPFL